MTVSKVIDAGRVRHGSEPRALPRRRHAADLRAAPGARSSRAHQQRLRAELLGAARAQQAADRPRGRQDDHAVPRSRTSSPPSRLWPGTSWCAIDGSRRCPARPGPTASFSTRRRPTACSTRPRRPGSCLHLLRLAVPDALDLREPDGCRGTRGRSTSTTTRRPSPCGTCIGTPTSSCASKSSRATSPAARCPTYSFIEPRGFSAPGWPSNDQHPPHSVLEGEKLIANIYDTLRGEEAVWRQCLFVLLYDEHGGFYDHVPPPAAVVPDATSAATPQFRFDRLGVRVPAILVSPWVGEGVADHTDLRSHLAARHHQEDVRPAELSHRARRGRRHLRSQLPAPGAAGDADESERALGHQPRPRRWRSRRTTRSISARSWRSPRSSPHPASSGGAGVDAHARDFLNQPQSP